MQKAILKPRVSISEKNIRIITAVFIICYAASSYIKYFVLDLTSHNNTSLLQYLQGSDIAMKYATSAIILHLLGNCAVPLLSYVSLHIYMNHKSRSKLISISLMVTLLVQIPCIVINSSIFSGVFMGIPLSYIMLYFIERHKSKAASLVFLVAAISWSFVLKAESSIPLILSVFILQFIKNKNASVAALSLIMVITCSFDLFYFLAPLSCIILCFAED